MGQGPRAVHHVGGLRAAPPQKVRILATAFEDQCLRARGGVPARAGVSSKAAMIKAAPNTATRIANMAFSPLLFSPLPYCARTSPEGAQFRRRESVQGTWAGCVWADSCLPLCRWAQFLSSRT